MVFDRSAVLQAVRFMAMFSALGSVACSSGSKSADGGTTGNGAAASTGATGTGTGGTGTSSGSATASGTTTSSTKGGCSTDLDCASQNEICMCGGAHAACPGADGHCGAAAETCQVKSLGTDCQHFADCSDSFGDLLCYCRADSSGAGSGVCALPQPACGACTQNTDCGDEPALNPPSLCWPLDGGSFCVPEDLGGCSTFLGSLATTVDAGLTLCLPSCNTCPCSAGCSTSDDCKAIDAGVCSTTHFCTAPCEPGSCPGGEVCNILDKYLDPRLTLDPALAPLYGGGQCGTPCTSAASCAAEEFDGGVALNCEPDSTEPNGDRCRPAGCIDANECAATVPPPGSAYKPWCDVFNGNACVADACRLGLASGTDCLLGDICVADGGKAVGANGSPATGECVIAPCNLSGGALLDCANDQMCCGEGDAGASSCPSGVGLGACYPAPNPPWCQQCDMSSSPFGQATCSRPANETQYGHGNGVSYCGQTLSGNYYCQPACDTRYPSSCPNGFICSDYLNPVQACSACGSNPCVDGGYSADAGPTLYCSCVDDAGTGCPSASGQPAGCSRQGFCSVGSYCVPGKETCN